MTQGLSQGLILSRAQDNVQKASNLRFVVRGTVTWHKGCVKGRPVARTKKISRLRRFGIFWTVSCCGKKCFAVRH